jgi:hypothetical protein
MNFSETSMCCVTFVTLRYVMLYNEPFFGKGKVKVMVCES